MLLGVVSAVHVKLGAVCGVYVRLVAGCLVHVGNMCLEATPFAKQNLDEGLALMIDSSPGHASVLTLQMLHH
jgi:hypothetical protein